MEGSVVWHSGHVACRRAAGSTSGSAVADCASRKLRTITDLNSNSTDCAIPVSLALRKLFMKKVVGECGARPQRAQSQQKDV